LAQMLALAMKFSRCTVRGLGTSAPRARTLRTEQRAPPVRGLGPGFLHEGWTPDGRRPRAGGIVSDQPGASPIASCAATVTASGDDPGFMPTLLRKEVIQPHLPVRLPCYDFTPIAGPTFGSSLPRVGPLTSGVTDFRGVTGGVYKARERIHRGVADPRLLATPTSRGRVADPDPN
jgi:hypothetical protein